jgi:hypothetical protein
MITRAWTMAALAVFIFAAGPVLAQTIDVRPVASTFLETALTALATVFTVVGGIGIRVALSYAGLANSQLERQLNERLDYIVHQGYQLAITAAQNEVQKPGSSLGAVKLDNWILKYVADYAMKMAPGIINRFFKLDRTKLEEFVLARASTHFNISVQGEALSGGLASTQLAKEATREVGKPGSVQASEAVRDAPVTLG